MNNKGLPSGKQYVYAFSSGKLVLLLSTVLILMALSFMLGIRIERFQKTAAFVETEIAPPATITLKPALPSAEEEPKTLTAADMPESAEVAEEKEVQTPAPEVKEEQHEQEKTTVSAKDVTPPVEEPKEKPKEVVAKEAASPPLPAPKKKAVQPPPAVASGRYGVQVSSSQDPKMAALQVADLKKKGFPSFTEETIIETKGKFYRVLVGPYSNEAEAATALSKLKKDANFADSYVRSLP